MGDDETGESGQFCPMLHPLHHAACSGNVKLLKASLQNGEDINMIQFTVPPLYVACMRNNKNVVEVLVKNHCDVNATTVELQQTSLHCAASKGLEGIAKFLIKHGADINKQDAYGATALFLAAQYGHTDLAKCLAAQGANLNLADKKGLSPLSIATLNGRTGVAELLIRKKAKLDQQDNQGNTALFHAVKSGQREICRLITKAGASVNMPNYDGDYPITIAAVYGNSVMIDNLIQNGCNVNVISPKGTPVFLAVQRQHALALQKLIAAGADVRKVVNDKNQREPLLEAMHQHKANAMVIRDLIAAGAEVDVECECHEFPIHGLLSKLNGMAMAVLVACDVKVGSINKDKVDQLELTCNYLYSYFSNGNQPKRLKALCRKSVKSAVGSVHYAKKIRLLKQPTALANYLLYKDVHMPSPKVAERCNDLL